MSASNRTFLYIQDRNQSIENPVGDSVTDFADYQEAMSYAKWMTTNFLGSAGRICVWNYNGGSGKWESPGVFTPYANNNWP